MDVNYIKDKAENNLGEVARKAKDITSSAGSEVVESGKDWLNYIRNHPLQSILFGLVGYFALKGMAKD